MHTSSTPPARPLARLHESSAVWVMLMTATVATTWLLSKDTVAATAGITATLIIAAWKIRLVVLDFMELRGAALPVRLPFEAWAIGAPAMILGFYLTQ